jgi:hypothetical protein
MQRPLCLRTSKRCRDYVEAFLNDKAESLRG